MFEKAIESPNFVLFYDGERKQTVRAPKSGLYTITAVGAKGGDCEGEQSNDGGGGYGALARGTFLLSEDDEIEVLVAGRGGNCRIYQSSRTGGGGGGASSVRVRHPDRRNEELLLTAAGGGGAGFSFHGEDGQTSPFGGWSWGGAFGGGGTIPQGDLTSIYTGGAGGGAYGDGASFSYKLGGYQDRERIWTQGGASLLNGGRGGFVDIYMYYSEEAASTFGTLSGQSGGYGGGGQGGFGE